MKHKQPMPGYYGKNIAQHAQKRFFRQKKLEWEKAEVRQRPEPQRNENRNQQPATVTGGERMWRENVKTIVRYYYGIPDMIKLLRQERADLENEYNGLRGTAIDGMPHGTSPGKPVEILVETLDGKSIETRIEEIDVKIQVLNADAAHIRACLDALNGKYKRVVSMRYFNEYSWTQISVRLGMPDSTARNRHNKAVDRLGEALEDVPMWDEILDRASRARV